MLGERVRLIRHREDGFGSRQIHQGGFALQLQITNFGNYKLLTATTTAPFSSAADNTVFHLAPTAGNFPLFKFATTITFGSIAGTFIVITSPFTLAEQFRSPG